LASPDRKGRWLGGPAVNAGRVIDSRAHGFTVVGEGFGYVRSCVGAVQNRTGWVRVDRIDVTLFCVGKMGDRRRRWGTGHERGDYTAGVV
jgi:hypothetical protein